MANNIDDAKRFFANMGEQGQAALAEVLNKFGTKLRKEAITEISQQLNLEPNYISRHISVRQRANVRNLQVTISAESRPVLLERYSSQQHQRPGKTVAMRNDGVSVHVKRSGSRKKLNQGFFIRLRGSNTVGLAMRLGKGKDNYKVLHGPSVSQAYQSVRNEIEPSSAEILATFFEQFNP
ncbi:hypothetical protein [Rheinheimera salexigens]|uniref:Uncharacterized protein n=1 Tax=Rheinheimera salexigens TaxID=1628148 RepID=A0A1E7Q808_9GAMM|nr:hypothetical protein [Rheinheimera salexigens]OEY70334.1 hypothetical protein BI198_12705 [Rheinheimera salexigens]